MNTRKPRLSVNPFTTTYLTILLCAIQSQHKTPCKPQIAKRGPVTILVSNAKQSPIVSRLSCRRVQDDLEDAADGDDDAAAAAALHPARSSPDPAATTRAGGMGDHCIGSDYLK